MCVKCVSRSLMGVLRTRGSQLIGGWWTSAAYIIHLTLPPANFLQFSKVKTTLKYRRLQDFLDVQSVTASKCTYLRPWVSNPWSAALYVVQPKSSRNLNAARKPLVVQLWASRYRELYPL
jgi:type VI protein secretion system component VasK